MPREKSEDKRSAILTAAIRLIAAQGLGVPTAAIAKEARIANGSLFTYFPTKAALFNELHLAIKSEMALAAFKGFPPQAKLREQFLHVWTLWMAWAAKNQHKRRVLALLTVCDELTPESREAGHRLMAGIAELMERGRAHGPLKAAPFPFVAALMNSLADATMDYMVQDPARAKEHSALGFDSLWRVLS